MTWAGAEAFADVQGRMKALAVSDPLLDLDRARSKLDRDWGTYQMVELALAAIDAVALRMDLDEGADQEEVVQVVASFAAVQQPDRDAAEYQEVAEWIIHRLINSDSRDRGFDCVVGAVHDGDYALRRFSFQLLRDKQNSQGHAVLAASDEAINVLVHALDVDIASEQVAAEAKLQVLLKKGDIPRARQAALEASLESQRYRDDVHAQLQAARRNVRRVDWDGEIKPVLDEALEHLNERVTAERELLDLVRGLQDGPLDADRQRGLDDLTRLLKRCEDRHLELSAAIGNVGAEIREEIVRQVFAPPAVRPRIHLGSQLLEPVLGLSIDDAARPLAKFVARAMGPTRPETFYLPDVLMRLSDIPEDDHAEPVEVEPVTDAPAEPPPVFTDQQEEAVRSAIASGAETGARLSALLQQIRAEAETLDLPPNTDALLALRSMQLYANPVDVDGDASHAAVVAVRDGRQLEDPVFGGDDLWVRAAPVADVALPLQATDDKSPTTIDQEAR